MDLLPSGDEENRLGKYEMNSRERFTKTMTFGLPDRVPLFNEGIRKDVLTRWWKQGMPEGASLEQVFPIDHRIEIQLDLDPIPSLNSWPRSLAELESLEARLRADHPGRFPDNWDEILRAAKTGQAVIMLRVHRGFFLSMGVYDWDRFEETMMLTMDSPEFVKRLMEIQGRFAASLAEIVLGQVPVDAAIFSEPIGGNHGPLISPRTYSQLVLPSYQPLFETLQRFQVNTIICRTYANARILIPQWLQAGVNTLWACECGTDAMDYQAIRQELDPEVRLIGGIDLDALRLGQEAIKTEILTKVPPLLASGGFIPMVDGRVRGEIPWQDYVFYRQLLMEVVASNSPGMPSPGQF